MDNTRIVTRSPSPPPTWTRSLLFYKSNRPNGWDHLVSYTIKSAGCFPGGKTARMWSCLHLHLMPRLEVRGTIPPLPHMPSWCAQGQLHLYILSVVALICTSTAQISWNRKCKEARISAHVWTTSKYAPLKLKR